MRVSISVITWYICIHVHVSVFGCICVVNTRMCLVYVFMESLINNKYTTEKQAKRKKKHIQQKSLNQCYMLVCNCVSDVVMCRYLDSYCCCWWWLFAVPPIPIFNVCVFVCLCCLLTNMWNGKFYQKRCKKHPFTHS